MRTLQYIIIIGAILIPKWSLAQMDFLGHPYSFTLKTLPLALINPVQQSLMLHSDIPFSERWGLDLGVGAVFNSSYRAPKKGETYQGFKVRAGVKHYYKFRDYRRGYIGIYFKYTYAKNNYYTMLSRQGGQYIETFLNYRNIDMKRLNFQFGQEIYLDKHDNWFIEPFMGFGANWRSVTNRPLPSDAVVTRRQQLFGGNSFGLTSGVFPDFALGCFLGWVKKRKNK
jgi:hypothetical protein